MDTDETTLAASPGRPLDDELTDTILDTTWSIVVERGYAAVDIQAIAKSVGCGKTSIYRRWANRSELVAAAFMHTLEIGDDPDTGNVVDDLVQFALVNARNQHGRMSHVLVNVVADDVMTTLWEKFYGPRQALALIIMRRGIERGELPGDADLLAILDLLSGITLLRNLVRQQETTRADFERIVPALIADPPRVTGPAA